MARLSLFILSALRVALTFVAAWLTLIFETDPYGVNGTFDAYSGFSAMKAMGSEHEWGIFTGGMTLIGAMAIVSASKRFRVFSATCFCMVYLVLAGLLTLGRPMGTGTGPYLGYAFISITLAFSEAYAAQRY